MTTTPSPTETIRPICQACQIPMHKAGFTWSGHNKRQRWQCQGCGVVSVRKNGSNPEASKAPVATKVKPTVKPPEDNHHRLCHYKCAFNQDGYCIRESYSFGCPYKEPEWNKLVAEQKR